MKKMAILAFVPAVLIFTGCYHYATKQAIMELANSGKTTCPFKAGEYNVRYGTLYKNSEYGTVKITHEKTASGVMCVASNVTGTIQSNLTSINEFLLRRFHDLKTDNFYASYVYPLSEDPNSTPSLYFTRKNGNNYEIFTNCGTTGDAKCGMVNNLKEIKYHTRYLKSTDIEKESFIASEKTNDAAYNVALYNMVQVPNYVLIPK